MKFNVWNRIATRKIGGIWYAHVGRTFPGKTKRQAIESAIRWLRKGDAAIRVNDKVITWIAARRKEKTSRHPLFVVARKMGFYS